MGKFTRDTAVTAIADNEWRAALQKGWRVGQVANGGYALAVMARALRGVLPHSDPLTINAFYLAPTHLGEVLIRTEPLRFGPGTSFGSADLWQDDTLKVRATAAYTDLDRLSGEHWLGNAPPQVPAFDTLADQHPIRAFEIHDSVETRIVSGGEAFTAETPSGSGEFIAWLRHCDGAELDSIDLLMMADIMPPPVFTLYGPFGWVPTIELTVQCRARPAPGPLLGRQVSRHLTRGIVETDGDFWDSAGQLVAISRQTMKVRLPRSGEESALFEG